MFTIVGLLLIFGSCTAGITKLILESLQEDAPEYDYDIPQFKRLASPTGAGMDSTDKDAYIRYLQAELNKVMSAQVMPPPPMPEPPAAPRITPPITPMPSPIATPIATPLESLPSSPLELPYDAPSNLLKLKDLILRGHTKSEVLQEVWGLTKSDKTGRPESKYQRCSKLFDRCKEECEAEVTASIRKQIESLEETPNGN
jgi:hypothetical protein